MTKFFVMVAVGDRPYPLLEKYPHGDRPMLFDTRRAATIRAAQDISAQAYGFEVYPWEMRDE